MTSRRVIQCFLRASYVRQPQCTEKGEGESNSLGFEEGYEVSAMCESVNEKNFQNLLVMS